MDRIRLGVNEVILQTDPDAEKALKQAEEFAKEQALKRHLTWMRRGDGSGVQNYMGVGGAPPAPWNREKKHFLKRRKTK